MLQLIELEAHEKLDKKCFTLKFKDDELTDQVWTFIEACLKNYNKYSRIKVQVEVVRGDKLFINLYVSCPGYDISDEEMDEDLEHVKRDFEEYYKKLIDKIRLIPILSA